LGRPEECAHAGTQNDGSDGPGTLFFAIRDLKSPPPKNNKPRAKRGLRRVNFDPLDHMREHERDHDDKWYSE